MYITSRHITYTSGPTTTWPLPLGIPSCIAYGFLEVDITIEQSSVSGAMPSEAHPRKAMPAESMITIAIVASQGILGFLVRILIDTGPGSVHGSISRWPVSARWLEHGRLVKDGLVVC